MGVRVSYAEIAGLGTPESAWQAWPGLASLPTTTTAELLPEGARLVVVAPHPDDEVLAAGGLMALAVAAGHEVAVVAVTDGTASHPGSSRWSPEALAATRPAETASALTRLGLHGTPVTRLGQQDGAVHAEPVEAALSGLLRAGDVVAATWRGDAHPDHEAVGEAAAAATAAVGALLLELPVWTWHWASPGDERVPWERARRLLLGVDVLQRKQSAVEAYQSQLMHDDALDIGAVLPPPVLERLLRDFETVLLP